jgi:hypothetical protein
MCGYTGLCPRVKQSGATRHPANRNSKPRSSSAAEYGPAPGCADVDRPTRASEAWRKGSRFVRSGTRRAGCEGAAAVREHAERWCGTAAPARGVGVVTRHTSIGSSAA